MGQVGRGYHGGRFIGQPRVMSGPRTEPQMAADRPLSVKVRTLPLTVPKSTHSARAIMGTPIYRMQPILRTWSLRQ